ncbi:hypothetical protein [Streptosporangium canum]|uniref:hypothetical protein n=1 Tax=Streptosporangium canum TaxID=324952 RepID=UPI0037BCE26E
MPSPCVTADRLAADLPQQTITLHESDLGHLDEFRQDLPYLSSSWRAAARAVTEGLNGRLKGHSLDLGDPKTGSPGRVAQTLLTALLVTVANDHFLGRWRDAHQPETTATQPPGIPEDRTDQRPSDPPAPIGKPRKLFCRSEG